MLEIITQVLGPVETNAYLVADPTTKEAVAIDPAWDGDLILAEVVRRGWRITSIWLTHAHFDHIGGAGALADGVNPPPPVALHPEDYSLWRMQGGAQLFGMKIDPGPEPTIDLVPGLSLHLGSNLFEVRHAPGHTPGHVILYCPVENVAFCGDVIFNGSVGRTDLPGGSYQTLMDSIRDKVLTMPDETRLYCGHGPVTTVGQERHANPFLKDLSM
jgi:glyoxylase-like metal-dependent hydrolase (beta-lactamase superfamily II)